MAKQNKKRVIGKNELLILLGTLVFVGFLSFVFGAAGFFTGFGTTLAKGNFSGSILINCSGDLNATNALGTNATIFYNATGGPVLNATNAAGTGFLAFMNSSNLTAFNTTVDISTLPDANGFFGVGYNISCFISNGTSFIYVAVKNVTIDNKNPNVTFVATNISNNGNYSNTTFMINISVVDSGVGMANGTGNLSGSGSGQVWINITNRTGQQVSANFTAINATNRSNGNNYYNATVNFAGFPDGKYNITVYANESPIYALINSSGGSVYHSNNSEEIQITIDQTAPNIPVLTNTTSTTTTQIVATITASDGDYGSGIDECTVQGVLDQE